MFGQEKCHSSRKSRLCQPSYFWIRSVILYMLYFFSGSNPAASGDIGNVAKIGGNKSPIHKTRPLSSCGGESSSSVESDNFLTVPQTVTASSSAETLTGKFFRFRKKFGILLPKLFWPTVRKKCSSDFCNFSAFSLKFQKFFSITRKIFSHSSSEQFW